MGHLLSAAQKMHQALEAAKRELSSARVEGSAGGGVVRVEFDGDLQPVKVEVSEEAWSTGREMLEDLLSAALKNGYEKASKLREERMREVTGGLDLPGLL